MKLKWLLTSRKFWASIIGLAFILLEEYVPNFPFTADQVTNVVYVVIAYILGTAIDDNGRFRA